MVTEWAPRSGAGGLTGSKGSDGSVRVSSEASDGCTARNATSQCADGFREVDFLADSRVLWAHHLGADRMGPAVSTNSTPGALRRFAHEMYLDTSSGQRPQRAVRCTGPLAECDHHRDRPPAHVDARAYAATGSAQLDEWKQQARGHEPLFTAQSLVGPASEGRR